MSSHSDRRTRLLRCHRFRISRRTYELTMYVDNKSHELFRRFIRRQLRMHPAVLRTNTVAVSLIPLPKEDSAER